ncbi:hypothetical protein Tco_1109492 [Tanacetum coccineum]
MNGLSVVPKIANQSGNGNVVTAPAEGNGNGINGNPIRCYNYRGESHYASNCTVKSRKQDAAYLQQQLQIAQEEEAGIHNTQEEFEFITTAYAHEETDRVKVNCTSEDTLQQVSTSGTQSDNAPVYDSDGSTEVPKDENCYDHDIFNMLTHEVQCTDLQTELDHTKEKLENCIIKKEKEYVVLWNNWYTKCEECKYDKISYDKAYNYNNSKFSSTYFTIITIIRGNFSLYYITCIVNISVYKVTCITKVDKLTQPTYGNPIFIYVKQTS